MAEELELFPGISERDTEKLAARGYSPEDVEVLIELETGLALRGIQAADVASVVTKAETDSE